MTKSTKARITYRTLRDLITDAARHTETTIGVPALAQVWLRKVGDHIEARATDRYVVAFILAEMGAQTWPRNLDVGLTPRQWRTALDALKPARGQSLDQTLTIAATTTHVVIASESGDTVTLARIPGAPMPDLDRFRTVPADSASVPLRAARIDGRFLARTPRTPGLVIPPRADDRAGVLHIIGDLWHIAIQPQRDTSLAKHSPIPEHWTTPTTDEAAAQ